MIRKIVTDVEKLKVPSRVCENPELIKMIIQDLVDTANAHEGECAGLAANQIGYRYRVFVVVTINGPVAFVNPEVMCFVGSKSYGKHPYEGCLSFPDRPPVKVKRYKELNLKLSKPGKDGPEEGFIKCKGMFARIVQHEMDHLDGVLI